MQVISGNFQQISHSKNVLLILNILKMINIEESAVLNNTADSYC